MALETAMIYNQISTPDSNRIMAVIIAGDGFFCAAVRGFSLGGETYDTERHAGRI